MVRQKPARSPLLSADSRFAAAFVLAVAFFRAGRGAALSSEPDERGDDGGRGGDGRWHRGAAASDASASDRFSSRGLFPPAHEYDALAIDPISMFGSPLGGFSRATAGRLASIPLRLPLVSRESPPEDPAYLRVRDESGRLFACRVYHQDELEPSSWSDGLFDAPRLARPASAEKSEDEGAGASASTAASAVSSAAGESGSDQAGIAGGGESVDAPAASGVTFRDRRRPGDSGGPEATKDDAGTAQAAVVGADGTIVPASPADGNPIPLTAAEATTTAAGTDGAVGRDSDSLASPGRGLAASLTEEEVEDRLGAFEGLCAHIHLGYWSTEWCYKSTVRQYHVSVDAAADAVPAGVEVPQHQVRISEVTRLGQFERRKIDLVDGPAPPPAQHEGSGGDRSDRPPNPLAGGRTELARVLDVHGSGDVCDVTGQPRTALVQILCCGWDAMVGGDPGAQQASSDTERRQTDDPPPLPAMALHGVYEDPDRLCSYVVTVCTNVLCAEDEPAPRGRSAGGGGSSTKPGVRKIARRTPGENESVREILDRSLGDRCLDATTDGWWSYSYCHGDKITQYHEVIEGKKSRSGVHYTAKTVEAEHLLGLYREASVRSYPDDEEWKHVVNATGRRSRHGGGSGTYFEMAYTDGDVCDHSDVTGAAIVAGGTGQGGPLSRGSNVRFFCGKSYMLAVNEDSTCHYIVEVTVPDLCDHPLFKEPVLKKQIVKCLLVDDGHAAQHVYDEGDHDFEHNAE